MRPDEGEESSFFRNIERNNRRAEAQVGDEGISLSTKSVNPPSGVSSDASVILTRKFCELVFSDIDSLFAIFLTALYGNKGHTGHPVLLSRQNPL
jgi:hypothetical protein